MNYFQIILLLILIIEIFTITEKKKEEIKQEANGKYISSWMGLERTGENIQSDLSQISSYSTTFTDISYERYDLGSQSTLVNNGFTDVTNDIKSDGLGTWPMITTVSLTKFHELMENPNQFITQATEEAVKRQFTGYNIDFEIESDSESDAQLFAQFLTQFADALHQHNIQLSVDIASWSTFWDFDLISNTSVDWIITMDTYCGNDDLFVQYLQKAIQKIPIQKLLVGLITVDPNTQKPFTTDQLILRFSQLTQNQIKGIGIWDEPVPDNWWYFISSFINGHCC
ncbi:chitinase domain-containing protein [Anaeramoeba ignava]|uniref:Chitinase domain-containing protein n=1 Tax=Anaeramoeba ignava TaxID=1746090 RepID=A0A9Q0L5D8_ANAIG|nr:chitinase domain-containing protein [Anaeramoeba ignava]